MRKIVKQVGNSLGLILNKEDVEAYGLSIDDVLEITIKKVPKEDQ